ncbi:MATE family efflux transporter [Spongorhabdus nitratireducens]
MNQNLTQGAIVPSLLRLALPIMGMSFVQMAYNMVDMIWLGRVGADAVAAVGTATFFTWLGMSLQMTTKTGAEITISQEIGRGNQDKAAVYGSNSLILGLLLAVIYGVATFVLSPELIAFFKLEEQSVNEMATSYLQIIAIGAPFYYLNLTFSGVFTGAGNSRLPFKVTSAGLILNIIIDPLFIFGWGPFSGMGSNGAAIATVLSQLFVTVLFIAAIYQGRSVIKLPDTRFHLNKDIAARILKLGFPVASHMALFACFSIAIARIVSQWGALPIAVQSVGAQIEAVSWMTAEGFATALGTFTGQNYGANKWHRIYAGFLVTVAISVLIGAIVTLVFLLFGEQVFSLFIPEPDAIQLGAIYLGILGISQMFMCMEISTSGAFYGVGKTIPPTMVSIILTGMRIPLALLVAKGILDLGVPGVEGVWWVVSLTSVAKGVLLFGWFYWFIYHHPERKAGHLEAKLA